MLIGGLQRLTLVDYPDEVAATVFTCGCDFRCPFCHNPELVLPRQIKNQPKISAEEVLSFLKERVGQLDGVCLTGGEPAIHKDLPDFIKKIKQLGFLVKLDTNGGHPEALEYLLKNKLVDYVAMDVKAPIDDLQPTTDNLQRTNNNLYAELTGNRVNLNKIKKSIKIIMNSGIDYEFRTTVIKGVHTEKDIIDIAEFIRGAKKYYLQPFVFRGKIVGRNFKNKSSFSAEELRRIAKECEKFVKKCAVRD